MTTLRPDLPPLPPMMERLPIDPRGFPVPWFVSKIDGEWNFQAVDPRKVMGAHTGGICWICGGKLHRNRAFVIGPMCAVTRTNSEPPSHVQCATFAARACPFLTKPRMRRMPVGEGMRDAPGLMLDRNPGVCLVWTTHSYRAFRAEGGKAGMLFQLGVPVRVEAYSQGRPATPEELRASITSGLPRLYELAGQAKDPLAAVAELDRYIDTAYRLLQLPAAERVAS